MCKINIEIEYLTGNMVNFHIRENDVFRGKDAMFFFKNIAEALFKSGISVILTNIKKSDRKVSLFVRQCGMKPASETQTTIIYYLRSV